jgi:hypothetical protein
MSNQQINQSEQVWHNDGHELILRINRADLEVLEVICPHQDGDAICRDKNGECIISAFIMRYGMDCNAGISDAHNPMKICWTLIGDKNSLDECQVWFMPVADQIFSAWLNTSKK